VFLIGFAAYIITQVTLYQTANPNLIPLLIFLASLLVPVTFVTFCWEQGASLDIPLTTIGAVFASGATTGLIVAGMLENTLLANAGPGNLFVYLIVGLCEEAAKAIALVWFLGNKRLHSEMHGLILGVTVGMGFAAFETAGYGFTFFLKTFMAAGGNSTAFAVGIANMISVLNLRMVLAIFGHGVWAAIVAAAIWRERGTQSFKLTPGVWLAYGTAVVLHGLFDTVASTPNFSLSIECVIVVGLAGLVVLRFFVIDARAHAKLGPNAPALGLAFKYYLTHLFERNPYPVALPNTP
jgi:RsiW-degrading membrane proteinase PrsW (M82 family)